MTDLSRITFAEPALLWLLAVPAALVFVWTWRTYRRWHDLVAISRGRTLPVRQRFAWLGEQPFWLAVTLAAACLLGAVARPQGPSATFGRAGLDIVVLQDGSASMQVLDGPPDAQGRPTTRWQRSMRFVRELGDALSWTDDRMALTVFARIATPQIRLTSDPNTVFFFLDHLSARPTFRLEDDTAWDTNLEQGIAWGLRLLEKDREIHGPTSSAQLFIMLSDGEAWSGEVARSLAKADIAGVPLFVIGAGTLGGAMMPDYVNADRTIEKSTTMSRLDRASLQRIADAGAGRYFELDRDTDRDIANAIIDYGRRSAPPVARTAVASELYWPLVAAAAGLAGVGLLFVAEPAQLGLLLAGAGLTAAMVGRWLF